MKSILKQRSVRLAIASAMAVAGAGFAVNGFAAVDTDNLLVSADVAAICTITTAPVAFGTYDPTSGTDLPGTGTVTVLCTNGAATTISLGEGANADTGSTAAAPLRRMIGGVGGTDHLAYFLYSDALHADVWGNDASSDVPHTGTGASANLTVYGEITALQNATVGAYADTVVATVTF
jgi:spore coat protein U-like protein